MEKFIRVLLLSIFILNFFGCSVHEDEITIYLIGDSTMAEKIDGIFYDVHGEYPDLIRIVAGDLGVPLIDLHKLSRQVITAYGVEESKKLFLWLEAGEHKNYPAGRRDNTHFTPFGAETWARIAAEQIRALDIGLSQYVVFENLDRVIVTVDKKGRGDFSSIQDALDSVSGTDSPVIIVIRNGIYNEKLFITGSDIALVGEHRDSTRILFAELRSNWTEAADNRPDGSDFELDWGSAVINIGNGVSDITIANMTVHNNYGSLYDDRGHQFTVRGFDATRISILYSTIISDGGDAVALWNRESGLYYHAYSHFEGWVDYVCPRGWAYITHSTFFGHNMTASLWHDGSADKDQKFVIRSSYIDGVPGFSLGRHHRDGQFYFLDVTFSEAMADQPIHYPDYSPNAQPWKWERRHYYYNCTRVGGDYKWFRNNLETAEGSPSPEEITAEWTFGGRWRPAAELEELLHFMKSSNLITGEFPELH
jgi:pectinesterase